MWLIVTMSVGVDAVCLSVCVVNVCVILSIDALYDREGV